MRTPFSKKEPEVPVPTPAQPEQPAAQKQQGLIIEREINISLVNDKLNYIVSVLNKVAEAAEIDLEALNK